MSEDMTKDSHAAPQDLFGGGLKSVPVLVPLPAERAYSYLLPEGAAVIPGQIVQVPLGPRLVPGIVWDGATDAVDPKKLKSITQIFDCPIVPDTMRRFIDWVANYTLTPPGLVARMVLRVPAAFEPEPAIDGIVWVGPNPERLTPARKRVIEMAAQGMAWTASGLASASGVSKSVVDGLVAQNCFQAVAIPRQAVVAAPDAAYQTPKLSDEQRHAAEILTDLFDANDGEPKVALLDGVTGSGKTEVYFEAIAEALKRGKQVLILLPEIALTEGFLERFHQRFGAPPAEWHSDLAPKKRERIWRQVAEGHVRVVAGARSALFLPMPDLGLIIVDEEHDSAYKQDDRTYYHARDMAVVRGSFVGAPVILASATPSLETYVNAERGRYALAPLPGRFAAAAMPKLECVDMRQAAPERGKFLSPVLVDAIRDTIEKGEQALLFLNRRGYAPLTLCRVCGHRFQCPNCSTWLVEHRFRGRLNCHHCGHFEKAPEHCPSCGTLDHLVACGPGVERITEEVLETFSEARVVMLSSDMMGGVKRLRLELEDIAKGNADIIIGTQLVAKGHNFPLMSLVGVVDADLGLANGDLRAGERTFQLLSQVTGRAGRSGLKSRGLLQTYQPDHPIMKAIVSGDRDQFYAREMAERQRFAMPPYGRLAALIISGEDKATTEAHAKALRAAAKPMDEVEVLGPAEAPLSLIRGRYRYRLLVHAMKATNLQAFVRAMVAAAPRPKGSVRVSIDIDPQSFL